MKTALITGANRGLGLALCEAFNDGGYTVFAGVYGGVDASQTERLRSRDGVHIIELDVGDTESVRAAHDAAIALTPSLDVVVNNAGITGRQDNFTMFEPLDFDCITELYNVNTLGALRVVNVFSDLLALGSDKLIVNISSEAASLADSFRTDMFGYCMSKTALNMAGTIMQNEFKKQGGQVLLVHPGWMRTYMGGTKNESAHYEAEYSAGKIYTLTQTVQRGDAAQFVDLHGEPIRW